MPRTSRLPLCLLLACALLLTGTGAALAHAVAEGDKGYIQEISGVYLVPFVYLGAKHMVTGYDHLMFLAGVIFFLYRLKDIGLYVSLFSIGHSTTMLFGVQPNTKVATLVFGLFHGFGLTAKIQECQVAQGGLVPNQLAFNVGMELGQLLALFAILTLMGFWRRTAGFQRHAYTANVAMMCAGFVLIGMQLTGYFVATPAA